jgi:hypothetical protein
MKASTEILLSQNLKALNLSQMLRHLETMLRQARETGMDYGEFLLALTEIELQMRAENRLIPSCYLMSKCKIGKIC